MCPARLALGSSWQAGHGLQALFAVPGTICDGPTIVREWGFGRRKKTPASRGEGGVNHLADNSSGSD